MRSEGVFIVAVLLVAAAAGCGDSRSGAEATSAPRALPVHLQAVTASNHTRSVTIPGIVAAEPRASLSFRVDGFVERFHVHEGDRVEAGALIAELDRADLEREVRVAGAAVKRSEARADEAQRSLERQKQLLEASSVSHETFDAAEAAHREAQAALEESRVGLETAEDRLEKTALQAPFAGYVEKRLIEEHEPAAANAPAVVLTALDPILVRGAVADSMLPLVRVGTQVAIRSPAWPERSFAGDVTRIAVAADPGSRTVPFEVTLSNEDAALRPEMVVEIEIPTGESALAVDVPLTAVLRGADLEPFCFVIVDEDAGPLARKRPVELGTVYGDRVTIRTGLDPGDRVVVRGQHFLAPGDRVEILAG